MIQLTPAACQEINRLRQRQNQPNALCRLDLQPSGCAQWSYAMKLETACTEADDVYAFQGNIGEISLVVRREHLQYMGDLSIDFSEDLMGGAFRFDNPLSTESCRCGYAFAIAAPQI
ncbi:MAG: iron-sulfur cluster assembly accessory protein [Phormidesmis sp.]